ncbi:MAG: peptidase M14, partial [Spirochaetota bacterium]|nr:peptidase M14 [Spirochaetota bacterium]
HLATLFSRTVIYFTTPEGTQTMAFSELCPSVTVECGKPGQPYGEEHAFRFLDACLHLDHFPEHPVHHHDIELYHTVATVRVPESVSFSFDSDNTCLRLRSDLDHLNFRPLPAGTILGYVDNHASKCSLEAENEAGEKVSSRYFIQKDNTIQLNQDVMPSMLTLNEEIIRQDCLCYFMEQYNGIQHISEG